MRTLLRRVDPAYLWLAAFVIFAAAVLWLSVRQHDTYWNTTLRRVQTVDFNMVHAQLPYALAYLERQGRRDLIQQTLDANFGLFGLIYTDNAGHIIAQSTDPRRTVQLTTQELEKYKCSYVYRTPQPPQLVASSIYDEFLTQRRLTSTSPGSTYGRLYTLRPRVPSFSETLARRENWQRLFGGGKPPSDYFMNILLHFGLIGLAALICSLAAVQQRRIAVLEAQRHQGELKTLQQEAELARNEQAEQSLRAVELKGELNRLAAENQVLGEERSLAEQEQARLQQALSTQDGQVSRLRIALHTAEEAAAQVARVSHDLESARGRLAQKQAALTAAQSQMDTLAATLEQSERTNYRLSDEWQRAAAAREQLQQGYSLLDTEVQRLKSELSEAEWQREQAAALKSQLQAAEHRYRELEAARENADQRLAEMLADVEAKQTESRAYYEAWCSAESAREAAERQLSLNEKERRRLKEELGAAQWLIARLERMQQASYSRENSPATAVLPAPQVVRSLGDGSRPRHVFSQVWPSVVLTPHAARELEDASAAAPTEFGVLCHLLAQLEASEGNLGKLKQGGLEIKKWQTGSGFYEIKKPPTRILLRARTGEKTSVERVTARKNDRTEDEFNRHVRVARS